MQWIKKFITVFAKTPDPATKYEVISHIENFNSSGCIYVKIRVKGINKTFYKPVAEVYQKEWINDFSREDSAFIAVLFFAEQTKTPHLIHKFPTRKKRITRNVVLLGMLFVSCLILSNITAGKIVQLQLTKLWLDGGLAITFPAALVFFPLTYFFDNNLTEVYGFQVSRLIIWGGVFCNTLVSIGIFLTIQLPSSRFWQLQSEYATIFGESFRFLIASTIAYCIGEFCNSIILAKFKIMTAGRWLWFRIISSTSVAVAIDSTIFCHMAFTGKLPLIVIWHMIGTQYLFKVGYEIFAMPVTYMITNYLKKKDNVDYYDYKTAFNPFSLKIDDAT